MTRLLVQSPWRDSILKIRSKHANQSFIDSSVVLRAEFDVRIRRKKNKTTHLFLCSFWSWAFFKLVLDEWRCSSFSAFQLEIKWSWVRRHLCASVSNTFSSSFAFNTPQLLADLLLFFLKKKMIFFLHFLYLSSKAAARSLNPWPLRRNWKPL